MDDTQSTSELNELRAECQWLRKQVKITLILLIMVSAILTLFLQRQNKYTSSDLNGVAPAIEEYTKTQGPLMDDFIARLLDYGHTHQDFAPIYKKYGLDKLSVNRTNAPAK